MPNPDRPVHAHLQLHDDSGEILRVFDAKRVSHQHVDFVPATGRLYQDWHPECATTPVTGRQVHKPDAAEHFAGEGHPLAVYPQVLLLYDRFHHV